MSDLKPGSLSLTGGAPFERWSSVSTDNHPPSRTGRNAPFASTSQASSAKPVACKARPSSKPSGEKTITDVIAGALARAASQSTIHPLDTLKVRIQAGRYNAGAVPATGVHVHATGASTSQSSQARRLLLEAASLYKGVLGAATGAGIIIGSYFAFYSTTKQILRERTSMQEGSIAFCSGATAAVGSSFIKVPIAVCIRSVQAGVYQNAYHAFKSITSAAGWRGLFTGFVPTLLEDVPDMAVKFAVYESMRTVYFQLSGKQAAAVEDLLMGGSAGAAAAAATTPLDVVKTRMMCSASQRPTIRGAVQGVIAEGLGWKGFFRGVGPRALSNGINSAVFFCFFEAIRKALNARQAEEALARELQNDLPLPSSATRPAPRHSKTASLSMAALAWSSKSSRRRQRSMPCLSLAIPLPLLSCPWNPTCRS